MSLTDQALSYREIVTKAVCGKGRKYSSTTHHVVPEAKPSSILGCWIINHRYEAHKEGNYVHIAGSYEINIWFSTAENRDTDVAKQRVGYTDQIPLTELDAYCREDEMEVYARVVQEPNCVKAVLLSTGDTVIVEVEREMEAEIIGETKLCVIVCNVDDEMDKHVDTLAPIYDDYYNDLDPDLIIDDLD